MLPTVLDTRSMWGVTSWTGGLGAASTVTGGVASTGNGRVVIKNPLHLKNKASVEALLVGLC